MIIVINSNIVFLFHPFPFNEFNHLENGQKEIQTTPWVTKLNPFSYLSLLHDYFQTARIVLRLILTSFYVSFFIDCYFHCLSSFICSRKNSSNMWSNINWINYQSFTRIISTWKVSDVFLYSISLNCLAIKTVNSYSNWIIDLLICSTNPFFLVYPQLIQT